MEKVLKHSETLPGTELYFEETGLEFTYDEKKIIFDLIPEKKHPKGTILEFESIKGYSEESFKYFFLMIEVACNWMSWMIFSKNRQDNRGKIKEMLKSFEQTQKFLKQIYNQDVYIPLAKIRELKPGPDILQVVPKIIAKSCVHSAWQASQPLEYLIDKLKYSLEPKKRSGSPGSYTVDFAKTVAYYYKHAFGIMPTTYFDGPFFKIIEQLFKFSGLDYKDPARAVRAAVKSVKTSK